MRIIKNLLLLAVAAALMLGLIVVGPWLWLLVHSLMGSAYGVAFIVVSLIFAAAIIRGVIRAWRRKPQLNFGEAWEQAIATDHESTKAQPDLNATFRAWLAENGLDRTDLPPFEMSRLRREFYAASGLG